MLMLMLITLIQVLIITILFCHLNFLKSVEQHAVLKYNCDTDNLHGDHLCLTVQGFTKPPKTNEINIGQIAICSDTF